MRREKTYGETGGNYLIKLTRNGRHFTGRYSWWTPRQKIPSLTNYYLVTNCFFLVIHELTTWNTGLGTGNTSPSWVSQWLSPLWGLVRETKEMIQNYVPLRAGLSFVQIKIYDWYIYKCYILSNFRFFSIILHSSFALFEGQCGMTGSAKDAECSQIKFWVWTFYTLRVFVLGKSECVLLSVTVVAPHNRLSE